MNGSFESPSHLERRIRAGLEDVDDSSLSAPGWARRQNSQSLSFQTEEGLDEHQSNTGGSNRILDELSSFGTSSKTPTGRSALRSNPPTATSSGSATQIANRSRSTLIGALSRSKTGSSARHENIPELEEDESSFDDFSRSQAHIRPSPGSRTTEGAPTRGPDPAASVSDADLTQETQANDTHSLPLTSTPHRSNVTRTQASSDSLDRSTRGQSSYARQSLARRVTEMTARDATRISATAYSHAQDSRDATNHTGTAWGSAQEHHSVHLGMSSRPSRANISVNTIQEADSLEESQAETSKAARNGHHETSADVSSLQSPNSRNTHFSPSVAKVSRTDAMVATPKPRIDRDRMQSYVLSTMKDPIREQRILRSARGPKFRAQRVPFGPAEDEEETSVRSEETTPARQVGSTSSRTPFSTGSSRLGRPMIAMAGRTPLPFKPSRLANQISGDDASSEQSSTYDLMTPAKGWENTSEPGFGVAQGNAARVGNRVDPRKLSRQVHKMNENLEEENAQLRQEADSAQLEIEALRRQLNTALREKEMMNKQLPGYSATLRASQVALPPSPVPSTEDGRFSHRDPDRTAMPTSYEDALDRVELLESHREELNSLLDSLEDKYEALQQENDDLRNQEPRPRREDGTDVTDSTKNQLQDELNQALGELDDFEYRLQESEDERARMQAAVEEAKEFAMEESQKAEQARDEAVAVAEQHQKTSEKLQRQVDDLQRRLERSRDDQSRDLGDRSHSRDAGADDLNELRDENDRLRSQLGMARDELDKAESEHQRVRDELEGLIEANEADLGALDAERAQLDEQLQASSQECDQLRDELDRHKIAVNEKDNELLKLTRQSSNDRIIQDRIEGLTRSLEVAERELQNMQTKLADSVPLAQMQRELEMKDQELDTLVRSKQSLEQRLHDYKAQAQTSMRKGDASVGSGVPASPGNETTLKTPAKGVHKTLLHLRTPLRTPQSPGPLSPASWLNETTIGNMDEDTRNIVYSLQAQLDEANAQIDERLAQIDELGLGHLGLVKSLKEANDRIESLEAEMERLLGAGGDIAIISKRLKSIRCDSCAEKFDATRQVKLSSRGDGLMSSDYGAPDAAKRRNLAKSARSHQRDQDLAVFIEKLPFLQDRLKQVEDENRRLREGRQDGSVQDDARVKELARELQKTTHEEIRRARAVIEDMDSELREERRRLPELARDSKLFGDLTSNAERELARTEVRLRAIDAELRRKVEDYEQYQQELMEKSSAGQLTDELQALEAQIRHVAREVDHLRHDKNTVLQVRAELHSQFLSASERYNAVEADLRTTREAVSAHERQIQSQSGKIHELHTALKSHRDEIRRLSGDRDRLTAQREMIIEDVSRLEIDLRRVRGESATFGKDLEKLRRDRDEQRRQAEVARESSVSITAEAQETIGLLRVQLNHARDMIREFEVSQKTAVANSATEEEVISLREKHVAESRGLLLQIRYLKTKFMRESDLRSDLVFQKKYLLQVVGGLDMNERETVQFLSDLDRSRGLPHKQESSSQAARHRLRKVFFIVMAASRMQCMARRWSETNKVKEALKVAHEDARSRRQQREKDGFAEVGEETVTPGNVHLIGRYNGNGRAQSSKIKST